MQAVAYGLARVRVTEHRGGRGEGVDVGLVDLGDAQRHELVAAVTGLLRVRGRSFSDVACGTSQTGVSR
ncbi:hypothetical protein [Nonomuraea jiangxiensis]|uniref:hypothetical protein n=1 Tax=Nonomuraea jiangxiensis TaxID=633440 RepID=UPI000B84D6E8|nr:hypothetical protein [Nonomuraea jiangxiensis]